MLLSKVYDSLGCVYIYITVMLCCYERILNDYFISLLIINKPLSIGL